jgi:hypothetical protein
MDSPLLLGAHQGALDHGRWTIDDSLNDNLYSTGSKESARLNIQVHRLWSIVYGPSSMVHRLWSAYAPFLMWGRRVTVASRKFLAELLSTFSNAATEFDNIFKITGGFE